MRYGQGISSSDLVADQEEEEDAQQISGLPDVTQLPIKQPVSNDVDPVAAAPANKKVAPMSSSGPDISAWRTLASQQLLPPSMSEFGAGQTHRTAQRASTMTQSRRSREKRLLNSSSTFGGLSMKSNKQQPPATEVNPVVLQPPSYGYTTVGWDSQMDVTRAIEIVLACGEQIRARGELLASEKVKRQCR